MILELMEGENECVGAEETLDLELATMETMNRRPWGQNPDAVFKFGLSFQVLFRNDNNSEGGGVAALVGFESRCRGDATLVSQFQLEN